MGCGVGCGGEVAARGYDGGDERPASPAPPPEPVHDAAPAPPRDAGTDLGPSPLPTGTPDATATPDATPDPRGAPDASPPSDGDAAPRLDGDAGAPDVPPLLCSPDADIPDAEVLAYAPVAPHLGACSPTVLAAYIAACYSSGSTENECEAWYADAGNESCIECLIPTDSAGTPTDTGALLVDRGGDAWTANFPGCFALVDPTNGPACAGVLEPQQQCEFQACGACATVSASNACFDDVGAAGAACSGYDLTPCSAFVSDAGFTVAACATPEAAINTICGTGPS